jgi:nucleotide-binding universal stress UspA family protein
MNRFRNILAVATNDDGLPHLVERAAALARRNNAQLTLLGVVDSSRASRRVTLSDGSDFDVERYLLDTRREDLAQAASVADDLDIRIAVTTGIGFVEVIRSVIQLGQDMVMVNADLSRRRIAGSSMAMHLLRKCPVPVWVDTGSSGTDDVAVALGPLDPNGEHGSLGITLLELGTSLAAIRGGDLHVIHAWRLEGESLLRRGRHRPPAEQVDALVEDAYKSASSRLEALMAHQPEFGVATHVHLEKGDPHAVITGVLERYDPGVIVMGTLARTGMTGVFMGNTAERVLGTVDTSVLAVKPDGFRTPVEF